MQRRLLIIAVCVTLCGCAWFLSTLRSTESSGVGGRDGDTSVVQQRRDPLLDPVADDTDNGNGDSPSGVTASIDAAAKIGARASVVGQIESSAMVGTVRAADGLPPGEGVQVRARHSKTPLVFDSNHRKPGEVLVDVDPLTGEFAIDLPGEGKLWDLDIVSDFLAVAGPVQVRDGQEDAIVLAPTRGGCVRLTFIGPAAVPEGEAPEGEHTIVAVGGTEDSDDRAHQAFRSTSGRLHIGGLPQTTAWRVRLDAKQYVDAQVLCPRVAVSTYYDLELPLSRGVAVTGRVTDEQGDEIAGAEVELRSWIHGDASQVMGYEAGDRTDRDGRFEIAGVLPGAMRLVTVADGFLVHREDIGERQDGDRIESLAIVMLGGDRITGTVEWPDGQPAKSAEVRVASTSREMRAGSRIKTDAHGKFEATGLRGNAFRIAATARHSESRTKWVASTTAASGADVALVLGKGHSVKGRVVDDMAEPLAEFDITANPQGPMTGLPVVRAKVRDGEGDFELVGLSDGVWDLQASAPGHARGTSARVTVPGDADAGTLVLPRYATLAGTVVDRTAKPIAGATVTVRRRKAETDAEGAFQLERLEPGVQPLRVTADGFGQPIGEPLVLAPGESRQDHMLILGRGATVLGSVHPDALTGVEMNATLRVDGDFASTSVPIDAEGKFKFEGVEAGSYWAGMSAVGGSDFVENHQRARPVPIDVPADETVTVVVGGPGDYPIRVFGQVLRDGEPAQGLLLYAYLGKTGGKYPTAIARTDEAGEYSVPLRVAGTYAFTVGEGQMTQVRQFVEVTAEPEQRVDFEMPDGVLRGRVELADGTPAAGRMLILAHDDAPSDSIQMGEIVFARTSSDGAFTFRRLLPGPYRLRSGNYLRAHDSDGLVVLEDIVIPVDAEPEPVKVVIPAGATVDVVAKNSDGSPVPGASIALEDARGYVCIIYDQREANYEGLLRYTGIGPGTKIATVTDAEGREIGRTQFDVREGDELTITVTCE